MGGDSACRALPGRFVPCCYSPVPSPSYRSGPLGRRTRHPPAHRRQLAPTVTFTLSDVVGMLHLTGMTPVVIACLLATWLLLAPLAIYFAVGDD